MYWFRVLPKCIIPQSRNAKLYFKVIHYKDIYRPGHFIVEIIKRHVKYRRNDGESVL